jgi:DNA-binding CsgD family transcriptional regulator
MKRKPQHDVRARYGQPLTAVELKIIHQLMNGRTDMQIAQVLDISDRTIRRHLQAAMNRLGARTRIQAVAMVLRSSLREEERMSDASGKKVRLTDDQLRVLVESGEFVLSFAEGTDIVSVSDHQTLNETLAYLRTARKR